jgi:ketosteroid isomerase-like protein
LRAVIRDHTFSTMAQLRRLAVALVGCVGACSSAMRTPGGDASASQLAAARDAIEPQFREMFAAANAHDTDRHLAAYQHSPALIFVANDQEIHGWDALREQQLKWWQNGRSDAVYTVLGAPEYAMPASDVVVQTYFLDSRRAGADGATHGAHLAVTDVWRKLPEGWRIVYAHESVVPR